ncbi:MAG: GC-type dockerin domain-anchored protein [Phycisphaerales bacterium JB039]
MSQSSIIRTGAAALAISAAAGPAAAQCTIYRLAIPDFDQRRSAFPNDGKMYCVPTATANALAYLANNGYAGAMDGPKDWTRKDSAMYDFTSTRIQELAILMGTSATKGTKGGKWIPAVKIYLDVIQPQNGLALMDVYASTFVGVDPHKMSNMMKAGAIIMPNIGWYDEVSPGKWTRTGGHLVTMWGGFNICSGNMLLAYNDPANDSVLSGQGPFTSSISEMEKTFALFKRKSEPVHFPRTMWKFKLYNGGFLDGFHAIFPLYGLTSDAFTQDISFVIPKTPTSDPGPPPKIRIKLPTTRPMVAFDYGLLPTTAFVLTEADGRNPGKLWHVDFMDESVTEIASVASPKGMVTGRDGCVYVVSGASIHKYGLTAPDQYERIDELTPPIPPEALHYDDATDELVVLSVTERSLMRIQRDLGIRRSDFLPTEVFLLGDGSVTVNPIDGSEWVTSRTGRTLSRLTREPATGRYLPPTTVDLPGVLAPEALQFDDRGRIVLVDGGKVREFEPDGAGGWRARRSGLFDGTETGRLFRIARSRTNFDEATMAGEDDINILPPDTGPGTPQCLADVNADGTLDFFDFLEFQNMFAIGDTDADFTRDGLLDFFDFLAFQNEFARGC